MKVTACKSCGGKGTHHARECRTCRGTGAIITEPHKPQQPVARYSLLSRFIPRAPRISPETALERDEPQKTAKAALRAQRLADGHCCQCGNPQLESQTLCQACLYSANERTRMAKRESRGGISR